jgi:tRNA(Ile)-lysidine synthase
LERADFPAADLVVALSGGPDSALCARLAQETGMALRAVFVDHGLPASRELREAAGSIADLLDVPFDVVTAHVDVGPGLEERAREARYQALEQNLKPGEVIVTGHNADDQAETVLVNFLRGAGARGLGGMPRRRGVIARPLLDLTREEIRNAATEAGLPWIEDRANLDMRHRRNRVRHELIPLLEHDYSPSLRSILARTADSMRADDQMLQERADDLPLRDDGEAVLIPAAAVTTLPPPVATRLVRRALRRARPPHPGSKREVEAVMAVARGETRFAEIAGGLSICREGALVALYPGSVEPAGPVTIAPPVVLKFDRWQIDVHESSRPPALRPLGGRELILDADSTGGRLTMRAAGKGDTIDIADGTKSVSDVLAEAGVPVRFRHRWPVLVGQRVLAVPGIRAAHHARFGAATTRYLWVLTSRS